MTLRHISLGPPCPPRGAEFFGTSQILRSWRQAHDYVRVLDFGDIYLKVRSIVSKLWARVSVTPFSTDYIGPKVNSEFTPLIEFQDRASNALSHFWFPARDVLVL